jgi:hypothetical protein
VLLTRTAGGLEVFWDFVIARRNGTDGALAVQDHLRELCASSMKLSA